MQKKYGIHPREEISLPKIELPEKPAVPEKPVKAVSEPVDDEYSEYSYSEYDYEEEEEQKQQQRVKRTGRKSPGLLDEVDNMFTSIFKTSKKLLNEFNPGMAPTETRQSTKKAAVRTKADIGGSLIDYDTSLQKTIGTTVNKSLAQAMEHVDTTMSELVGVMKEEDELWQNLRELSSQEYMPMINGYQ